MQSGARQWRVQDWLMSDNRRMLIAHLPDGPLAADNFTLDVAPMPEVGPGQILIRTSAFTIGAGQRAGLQGSASYAGAPTAGRVMDGSGVGEVIAVGTAAGPSDVVGTEPVVGNLVRGPLGWQEFAVLRADQVDVIDGGGNDPALHLGALGTNGITAYFGLLDVGRPVAGETVMVSAAAGSVGHLVGQIAAIQGARVVGVAGSDDKCRLLVDELGFDVAVNYRSADFRDSLKAATPDRIDVYFDNVGGDVLGSALFRMNTHGRIVCCGAVSAYDTASPGPSPRGIPGLLVNNRVRMEGFLVFDYESRYAEARSQMTQWIDAGQMSPRTTDFEGLESAGHAFVELLAGRTMGTTIVRVAGSGI